MQMNRGDWCPYCQSEEVRRIPRPIWMRFLIFTRYYECPQCFGRFMVLFGIFAIKTNFGAGT
ncbi:MAG: hypothetical protein WC703_05525 [Candidatus Neomarinimicrobiota bacterium]